MRFQLCSLATLVAAVTASPILDARQASVCTPPATTATVIAGTAKTLTGPFKIQASVPGSKLNGNYATTDSLANVIFKKQKNPTPLEFYIDQSDNHLIVINGATETDAYNYLYLGKTPHVALRAVPPSGSQYLTCSIDASDCSLDCTYGDGSATTNCLSSPAHDPQWAIEERIVGKCIAFTPVVVAG